MLLRARWFATAVIAMTAGTTPAPAAPTDQLDVVSLRAVSHMTTLLLIAIAEDYLSREVDHETVKLSVRQIMEDAIRRNPAGYTETEREASAALLDTFEFVIDEVAGQAEESRLRRLERVGGPRPAPSMTAEEAAANRRRLTGN